MNEVILIRKFTAIREQSARWLDTIKGRLDDSIRGMSRGFVVTVPRVQAAKKTATKYAKDTARTVDKLMLQSGIDRGAAAIAVTITVVAMALALTTQTRHSFRVYADEKRVVQIYVDGKRRDVVSSAPSVREVLAENGVVIKDNDVVDPGMDTAINQPNYNINIYRATPAVVVDEGRFVQVVTGYRSARKIAAAAGVTLFPEDTAELTQVQDFRESNTLGYKVVVTRAKPVQLVVHGELISLRTHLDKVGELLKEKSIEYDAADLQGLTAETKLSSGMRIILAKISQETLIANEPIAPGTRITYDAALPAGTSQVSRAGVAGTKRVTYLIERQGGVETKRSLLAEEVVTAAVDQIVLKSTGVVKSGSPSAAAWAQLRFCEAGGDYAKNTGNGYYGAYQMNIGFWKSYGDNPNILPSQASAASQDAAALRAYAVRGANPWPVCGRYIR